MSGWNLVHVCVHVLKKGKKTPKLQAYKVYDFMYN